MTAEDWRRFAEVGGMRQFQRGPSPFGEASAQGSYGYEAMCKGFEQLDATLAEQQQRAEAAGDSNTARLLRAIINVIRVVNNWNREPVRVYLGVDEASLALLEAIERGMDPAR